MKKSSLSEAFEGAVEQAVIPSPDLFLPGPFTGRSGTILPFKIECEAISEESWNSIARHVAEEVPAFYAAYGVPRGGLPFAKAMNIYRVAPEASSVILVCEDVWTTGGSISREVEKLKLSHPMARFYGVVLFAHAKPAPWCKVVFQRML